MSDQTSPTPAEAEAHLEQARQHAQDAASALDAVRAALDTARAEVSRLDALPFLEQADLLAQENARRYVRTLEAELPEREAANVAALAALAEAERDLARAKCEAALEQRAALAATFEKGITKAADTLRAKLAPLLAAEEEVRTHALAAGEAPLTPLDLSGVDAGTDAQLFLSLGSLLTARRERDEEAARLDREGARREAQLGERQAYEEAWQHMSEAERRADFEARVEQLKRTTGSRPGRGYSIDALRRMAAQLATGARHGWSPYVAPLAAPEFDEGKELDAIRQRVHEERAAAEADPFAAR